MAPALLDNASMSQTLSLPRIPPAGRVSHPSLHEVQTTSRLTPFRLEKLLTNCADDEIDTLVPTKRDVRLRPDSHAPGGSVLRLPPRPLKQAPKLPSAVRTECAPISYVDVDDWDDVILVESLPSLGARSTWADSIMLSPEDLEELDSSALESIICSDLDKPPSASELEEARRSLPSYFDFLLQYGPAQASLPTDETVEAPCSPPARYGCRLEYEPADPFVPTVKSSRAVVPPTHPAKVGAFRRYEPASEYLPRPSLVLQRTGSAPSLAGPDDPYCMWTPPPKPEDRARAMCVVAGIWGVTALLSAVLMFCAHG